MAITIFGSSLEEKLESNINHAQKLQSDEDEYCEVSGVKLDKKPKRVPHKCPACNYTEEYK